ncbi:MAG: sulfatase-like hydrolase/transferase [Chloroflexota bacterium]
MITRLFSTPWYPLVLGMYPIIALLAGNIGQAQISVAFKPLFISLAASALLFSLLRLLLRDWHRAAFLTSTFILLFFMYGHVYSYLKSVQFSGLALGRHRILLVVWGALAALAVWAAIRKSMNFASQASAINVISLLLLVYPLYTITARSVSVYQASASSLLPVQALNMTENQSLPDVYYIILDSYTRSDVLYDVYGYDNSEFLNDLRDMGFYVADCSSSNYMWTKVSIASTLNMDYLQDIPAYASAADKEVVAEDLLKHSRVRQTLEALGYETIAFATGYPFNELTDADMYLEPPELMKNVREFDALLMQTTLLRVLQDFGVIYINQTATALYRDRTLFAIGHLDELAHMGGPQFVYMHIIAPHPPFVFGPNGEYLNPFEFVFDENGYTESTYSTGYVDQVTFISNEIARGVQKLISESPEPPIIMIQGDHGPWKQEGENRVSILNAYYLPGHADALYPEVTPVNSFRVVLNGYFNAEYPVLEDVSYASPYANIHDFSLQPISCETRGK